MKVVYVAGPFRGKTPWLVEQNVRRAEADALEVWRLGAAALCPHKNTQHFQDSAPDHVWIEGTLELLRRCDAVLVGGKYEASTGTMGEIKEAERLGLPVFYALADLASWLNDRAAAREVGEAPARTFGQCGKPPPYGCPGCGGMTCCRIDERGRPVEEPADPPAVSVGARVPQIGDGDAFHCAHANENPLRCPCGIRCYCKGRTCQ